MRGEYNLRSRWPLLGERPQIYISDTFTRWRRRGMLCIIAFRVLGCTVWRSWLTLDKNWGWVIYWIFAILPWKSWMLILVFAWTLNITTRVSRFNNDFISLAGWPYQPLRFSPKLKRPQTSVNDSFVDNPIKTLHIQPNTVHKFQNKIINTTSKRLFIN